MESRELSGIRRIKWNSENQVEFKEFSGIQWYSVVFSGIQWNSENSVVFSGIQRIQWNSDNSVVFREFSGIQRIQWYSEN